MKKVLLIAAVLFMSVQAFSQSANPASFGVTAGYMNLDISSKYQDVNASVSESGFYVGAFAEFDLAPSFTLTPGVNYGKVKDSEGILFIPVMVQYYVGESDFYLQAGPQASIILEETGDDLNSFGLDGSVGVGYDITENFFIEGRYSFELTNRISSIDGLPDDLKARVNSLTIGVGYKF